MGKGQRYLSNIDCLTGHTACLVCFICTFNGRSKKEPIKTGASSGHITNLKESILETLISMVKVNKSSPLQAILPEGHQKKFL
jgi:hypothetical protein